MNNYTIKDGMLLFWDSLFSQWHMCQIVENGIKFKSAEHYMMYQKAILFNDLDSAEKILQSYSPREAKALGRKVKNFNPEYWDANKYTIVVNGNYAKFSQNSNLKQALLDTEDLQLVEASPFDKIWGIGLDANHPDATNPAKWEGQNLLGKALTTVRAVLKKELNNDT